MHVRSLMRDSPVFLCVSFHPSPPRSTWSENGRPGSTQEKMRVCRPALPAQCSCSSTVAVEAPLPLVCRIDLTSWTFHKQTLAKYGVLSQGYIGRHQQDVRPFCGSHHANSEVQQLHQLRQAFLFFYSFKKLCFHDWTTPENCTLASFPRISCYPFSFS